MACLPEQDLFVKCNPLIKPEWRKMIVIRQKRNNKMNKSFYLVNSSEPLI